MKNKKITVCLFLIVHFFAYGQSKKNLIGYWQSQDDSMVYYVYSEKQVIRLSIYPKGEIVDSEYFYGFYDNLKLPSINSLKDEGYHYFEVDSSDFDENRKNKDGSYGGIITYVIDFNDDKNNFQKYDIMRPGQRGTYKRIKQLPQKLADILKSKGIIINISKQDVKITLSIKSTKAHIYTEPDKPSKMFLIKGDILTVLQEKDNWVYILYVTNKNKEIKGWVKKEDVNNK